MSELVLDDLCVDFGGLRAVSHLSFTARAGGIKGVIGPNGAGKTSLFNAISGFVRPSAGRIRLGDQDITDRRPWQRAASGLARTFQNLQLIPNLSLLENVMLGAHARLQASWGASLLGLAGREERALEERALEKLALLGLDDRAGMRASDLGFADAKLLEIARALAAEPRVLLLDEPIAGVPLAEQNRIAQLVRNINASGVTVVLVEHNMRVVMSICDEILVMHHGAWLAEGRPAEVARDPAVIAAYLGQEGASAEAADGPAGRSGDEHALGH
jgi:branched-chain amino acid transport system ATP-binding protein